MRVYCALRILEDPRCHVFVSMGVGVQAISFISA